MSNVKCSFSIKFLLSSSFYDDDASDSNIHLQDGREGEKCRSIFKNLCPFLKRIGHKQWKTLTTRVNIAVIECLLQVQVTLALILLTAGVGMPIGWVEPSFDIYAMLQT